ncbi:MAG: hypothetical protein ACW98Y_15610 [Candidatus Thorarchaeota archaeon]|jgi:hypothetical protein
MSNQNDEPNMMGMCAGIAVIVIFFFGGFISMFMFDIFELGVGMILFFMMGFPIIGCIIGFAIIYKTNGSRGFMGFNFRGPGFFGASYKQERTVERNFVHGPPAFCSSCGGTITTEDVEWVGPLSVKCPYCGATLPTTKREI